MSDLRPSRLEILLETAEVWSHRSSCSRMGVGAVIAQDYRVVSTGYNGVPTGMLHCDHTCTCDPVNVRLVHADGCPEMSPCTTAIHAEANAIAYAARHGVAIGGGMLVVTMMPCLDCARLIVAAGITAVMYWRPYRDSSGVLYLNNAGVKTWCSISPRPQQ